jgi:hypothetical protein
MVSDPSLSNKVHLELSKLVSAAYSQSMTSDEGYCFKFTLPMTAVSNLITLLKIDEPTMKETFAKEWNFPAHAVMYNDPYYQVLLLLMYYGMKKNDTQLINNSFLILLLKLWNGRKYLYFKYCDKKIMNYVVTHMVNKKHNVSKYDSPLALLKDYFMPTILKKYQPEILHNPFRLKQLFMQSWCRIDQMFAFNPKINIESGEKENQGGLLPLYMKAKEQGLYVSPPTIMKSDDGETAGFEQYSTVHKRDEIVSSTADYITMNIKPQYPPSFISDVNTNTKVSAKVIEKILDSLHNHNYYDLIQDIIIMILSRTNINDKNDICQNEFTTNVKKNIVSSKNNDDVKRIQQLLNLLANKVFENDLKLDYNKYSNAQKMQICNVVLFGIIFNLRKHNCQGL